jgi:REP element-mobilizing transposase RayT
MPVKRTIPNKSGMFFITFTCYQWLSLIDKVNGYDIIYKWFDHLKSKGHFINGYVIMPNHVHALISFINTTQSINTIIGNGKRFMAYEIINRLKKNNETSLLEQLAGGVEGTRKENKKQHEVWDLSFDWKDCRSNEFVWQKLDYMHNNPCSGKWQLAVNAIEYIHSSARFYLTGVQGIYPVTNFMEMEEVDFNKSKE